MTQTANEFQGFFADFYDRLHNYTSDAEGFAAVLKSCGKDVLELGSGTGRIAIPLAKAGYNVTGIDRLSANCPRRDGAIQVWQNTIRTEASTVRISAPRVSSRIVTI